MNALYEALPYEYKGYKIDASYQTAIQIQDILESPDITDYEAVELAIDYLFEIKPPEEMWLDALTWWLNGWSHDTYIGDDDEPVSNFYQDQWRIISAFRSQYGIDLTDPAADMHWWLFAGLLSTLDECAYTRVCDIRAKKLDSSMSADEKANINRLKRMYRIRSDSEKEAIENEKTEILKILDGA